jgi:hypothetical protein
VRQDPSVNSKKKPHSEEEEKEQEEQEEEEVATALDGNDVSHEPVDMNACDHSKQGLETQIASETHNDPESEDKDGCKSSKNVPDDIDKDVTDVKGSMEVMGESEHSQNEFSHDNIDSMNSNDQSKHQPELKIGTENPNGPESEGRDSGDTSINVPGDYVGTDVIFVIDGTGPKEVMGGSEHSQNEFSHKNNDMNANDQYKQGPKTDIGTDKPKRPELEGADGGNVGTDIISPHEGASDDKSDEPPVLPSNPPPNGKIFMYQNIWN